MLRFRISVSADPDPTFYLNANPNPDPDPGSQTNADPCDRYPGQILPSQIVWFWHEKYKYLVKVLYFVIKRTYVGTKAIFKGEQ